MGGRSSHGPQWPTVREPEVLVIPDLEKDNDSVYIFSNPPNPTAEIVFFHDINWGKYKYPHVQTWMSGSEPPVCWPMKWLSRKYPEARILSVRHDSSVLKTATQGHMRLLIVAENVRQDILHCHDNGCPVFLVGHGFGSVVIKKLLRSMQERHDQESRQKAAGNYSIDGQHLAKLHSFLKNVKGVFFFAPPNHGSKLVDFTKESSRGSLLPSLQLLDADGAELNEWFRIWRGNKCKASAICAAYPTTVNLPGGKFSIHVVEEASVRYDVDSVFTSLTNHFTVCKLQGETDSSFLRLQELIDSWKQQRILVGLVGWWKMEEGLGNTCRDFSGKNAHGTHSNILSWGVGCLVLDGQGGVDCGTAAALSGLTPFSVSAWVKVPPNCEQAVIMNQRGPKYYSGEYQLLVDHLGRPGFWIWAFDGSGGSCDYELGSQFDLVADNAAHNVIGTVGSAADRFITVLYANRSISDNQWHHLVAVRDGKAGRIYVDGTLSASTTASSSVKALDKDLSVFIGYDGLENNHYFEGSIGEVRIYSRALSENEILSLHGLNAQL